MGYGKSWLAKPPEFWQQRWIGLYTRGFTAFDEYDEDEEEPGYY